MSLSEQHLGTPLRGTPPSREVGTASVGGGLPLEPTVLATDLCPLQGDLTTCHRHLVPWLLEELRVPGRREEVGGVPNTNHLGSWVCGHDLRLSEPGRPWRAHR